MSKFVSVSVFALLSSIFCQISRAQASESLSCYAASGEEFYQLDKINSQTNIKHKATQMGLTFMVTFDLGQESVKLFVLEPGSGRELAASVGGLDFKNQAGLRFLHNSKRYDLWCE